MNNLPRNLIYADQPVLKPYINGNELNKALYQAVISIRKSMTHPIARLYCSDWIEPRTVDVFNHAYYLCVLASNDDRCPHYFSKLSQHAISSTAMQMAIAILSLQSEKSDRVQCFLDQHEKKLRMPFLGVVNKFREQGRTVRMNFALRKLQPELLEGVDWERITAGFDAATIERIVAFWPDVTERNTVCRSIWQAYRQSPSQQMPHICVDDRFFGRLMGEDVQPHKPDDLVMDIPVDSLVACLEGREVGADDHGWVRKIVDYAKDRITWAEARPFRDMLNYMLRGTTDTSLFALVDEIEQHHLQAQKKETSIERVGTFIASVGTLNELKQTSVPKQLQ
jgi:hypothetical protein